jgi:hypothetical protein
MALGKGVNRYPRPGQRIAPATLGQVLVEPAPLHLVAGTPAEGLRLADLDETIWTKLPRRVIFELAELVLARVAAGCARRVFHRRHFPRPPKNLRLDQLPLEHRTLRCLAREGFDENPELLGERTIGDILSIRAFGPRCLVDLLSALETEISRQRCLDRGLTDEARQLARLPSAPLVRSDDPRFRALMSEIDVQAQTGAELAQRLIARTQDPPDPLYVTQQVRRLRERVEAMAVGTIEEELTQVFVSTANPRNREIVVGYYGWRDGRPRTLAEIGARYGMTRERTRQICAKLVRRKEPAKILAPVMDRTLAFLGERLPRSAADLEKEMKQAGLTAVGLGLESVATGAALLGRPVPFSIVAAGKGRLAVRPAAAGVPAAVVEAAKKETYYHGLATVGQVLEATGRRFAEQADEVLVVQTLQLMDGFSWLDRASGWFRLLTVAKHGLPKILQKALAVAGRIRLRDLAAAASRNRRVWTTPPPDRVLLEFCRQTPGVRVDGEWIVADPPRPWEEVLTGVEAQLVRVLKTHGPIMERGVLEDLCVAAGMNRFSFHAFLACSPVIAQFGHSVYGLLGAEVSPAAVQALVARHRAARTPMRVLDAYGRTDDGRVRLSYRLSKAASTYAVITVPAALKEVVCGKFELVTADGRSVGILAAKDGRAWGLGAFLRQHGARIDDYLVLTMDLDQRKAVIALDGEPPRRTKDEG